MEKAIITPLTGDEIIEVAIQEFKKRLQGLCQLQLNKEYAGFEIDFVHTLRLFGLGSNGGGQKNTIAWGHGMGGDVTSQVPEVITETGNFKSGNDPNGVRLEHDLPLTVETGDGRGGKITKKVKVKDAGRGK